MFLSIDPHNGLAIYEQIVRQVKFAVASEALRPGELVPSVRELARELAINPNTVARAYRQLQDEAVLQAVRGTGLEVAVNARSQCRNDRRDLVRVRLRNVLHEAMTSGLEADEVRKLVEKELQTLERELKREAV
ncbi:MAG: GntR family transcriptional regulator [Planctomycetia bacterium]|nr:GntR family transcriptional regulator [Planctomycetia bacterium]